MRWTAILETPPSGNNPQAVTASGRNAAAGDVFCITLTVQDDASARMTRYAQVLVTVA